MKKIFDRIQNIGQDVDATVDRRIVKMVEEFGEFSEAYLQSINFKDPKGQSPAELREHLLEEGCDMLVMVLDILIKSGFTDWDEIKVMCNQKLDKWEKNLK